MNKIKSKIGNTLLVATLVALAATAFLPQRAEAQFNGRQYGPFTFTGTNNMPGNTTNSLALVGNYVGVTRMEEVAISIVYNSLVAANVGTNLYVVFKFAMETNNIETVKTLTIPVAANGTTKVVLVTNITLGAIGYLILDSIGNNSAAVADSNIVIKAWTKNKFWGSVTPKYDVKDAPERLEFVGLDAFDASTYARMSEPPDVGCYRRNDVDVARNRRWAKIVGAPMRIT